MAFKVGVCLFLDENILCQKVDSSRSESKMVVIASFTYTGAAANILALED
jgi:hypothetical protein